MTELDVLPKYICSSCFDKVSGFHGFYRDVHAAQQNFIESLVKSEPEFGDAVALPLPSIADESNIDAFAEVSKELDDDGGHSEGDNIVEKAESEDKFGISLMESETCDDPDEYQGSFIDEQDFKVENVGIDEDATTEDEAKPVNSMNKAIDAATISSVIAEYFDLTCDLCSVELKSFKHAISHYSTKHKNKNGYLKCCGLKFKQKMHVVDHVRWHLDPSIFR